MGRVTALNTGAAVAVVVAVGDDAVLTAVDTTFAAACNFVGVLYKAGAAGACVVDQQTIIVNLSRGNVPGRD